MITTALVSHFLPGYLGMPARVVQERMMLVMLPALLAFIWWTW
jgi:hypothetical protein